MYSATSSDHTGSVAVVLRARPLRGGQPYVLLLQHNGVNSYSAAVQVLVSRSIVLALLFQPRHGAKPRGMPRRLFSCVCMRVLLLAQVVYPSAELLERAVMLAGVSGGVGRRSGSSTARWTGVAAPRSGGCAGQHASSRARCQRHPAQRSSHAQIEGEWRGPDGTACQRSSPRQRLRMLRRGDQCRARVRHHDS